MLWTGRFLSGSIVLRYSVHIWRLSWQERQINPYRFGGQVGYRRDGANRNYVRARHLDTQRGRWISRDPIGFEGGINLYQYAQNIPSSISDPTGYSPCQCSQKTITDCVGRKLVRQYKAPGVLGKQLQECLAEGGKDYLKDVAKDFAICMAVFFAGDVLSDGIVTVAAGAAVKICLNVAIKSAGKKLLQAELQSCLKAAAITICEDAVDCCNLKPDYLKQNPNYGHVIHVFCDQTVPQMIEIGGSLIPTPKGKK